jgi:small-conductance mechanosensitive channel
MPWWRIYVTTVPNRLWIAAGVLVLGAVLGVLVGVLNRRLLSRVGVDSAVEGTAFERTAGNFGTSTVSILGWLSTLFIFGVTILVALNVAQIRYAGPFWSRVASFVPQLFVAVFVVVVGLVLGDKAEVVISEWLRGVKLPESSAIPLAVKWSIYYIAALVALSQVGVATTALLVLLGAYALALIVLGAVALRQLLPAGTAGIYVILQQPYGIGDRVEIDGREGVVQEVNVFVTVVESDGREHVVPNDRVLADGIVRFRD